MSLQLSNLLTIFLLDQVIDQFVNQLQEMSKTIDFIETNLLNFTKIIKPESRSTARHEKKTAISSIKIQKSFVPERKSNIPEALRPEIEKLKQMHRRKQEEERILKRKLAEGKISRQEMHKLQQKQKKQATQNLPPQDKIVIDSSGQARDAQGNLIFIKNRTTDLLINKKKEEAVQLKNLASKQRIKAHQKLSRSLLDRNLIVGSSKRRLRRSMLGLQFLSKGSYQPAQLKNEVKASIENLSDVLAQNEEEVQVKHIKKRSKVNLQFNRDIPDVQWWDSPLIFNKTYLEVLKINVQIPFQEQILTITNTKWEDFIDFNAISSQCIFQKVGNGQDENRVVLPMYLTKEERKKLKRKRKQQKLVQKNDKIKLGLIQPDKPKLRVGNMAIVMKNQFIVDPSKVEAEAKKQTQERIDRHNEANSSRKLSKSQKKDKVLRKLKRDSAKECRRAVFRIDRLTDPSQIFKVNMNAKQLALNGFVIKPSNQYSNIPTMVLVEGGIRAVKFYKNLILKRINWAQGQVSNSSRIVWQGQIQASTAGKWGMHEVGDEVEVIRLLTQKKFQYFWQNISAE